VILAKLDDRVAVARLARIDTTPIVMHDDHFSKLAGPDAVLGGEEFDLRDVVSLFLCDLGEPWP
jgi:hypothetical protein